MIGRNLLAVAIDFGEAGTVVNVGISNWEFACWRVKAESPTGICWWVQRIRLTVNTPEQSRFISIQIR